jgi:hypothetical protein
MTGFDTPLRGTQPAGTIISKYSSKISTSQQFDSSVHLHARCMDKP